MSKSKAHQLMAAVNKHMGKEVVKPASHEDFAADHIPTSILPIDIMTNGGLPRNRIIELFGDYCVTPDTKVLTDALTWVRAGDLREGYGLIGFTEQLNRGRGKNATLQPSEVERLGSTRLQCQRIVTDRGEITASDGHMFVARHRSQGTREWRNAASIQTGDSLLWTCTPWKTLDTRDAGYAAGLLDGEGWLDGRRLSFGQLPGAVLEEGVAVLKRLGFSVTMTLQGNGVVRVAITGGRYETLRALGQLKPVRLLPRSVELWNGADMVSKGPFCEPGSAVAKVLAVEPVGKREVVTMQTSSRTFIANGFPSHNSTLKSYVGLCVIATAQANGFTAGLMDTEHAYDAEWGESLGVDNDELILKHPENGEEACDISETLIRGDIDLIVWDSVAATLPKEEHGKAASEKQQPGSQARMMSLALRKLVTANKHTALMFTNQTRVQIGSYVPETTPGGRALPFYASMRINLRKSTKHKQEVQAYGGKLTEVGAQDIRANVEKSKINTPHRGTIFRYNFDGGYVEEARWSLEHGLVLGYITKSGNTYTLTEDPAVKAVGKDNWITMVDNDEALYDFLIDEAWKHLGET